MSTTTLTNKTNTNNPKMPLIFLHNNYNRGWLTTGIKNWDFHQSKYANIPCLNKEINNINIHITTVLLLLVSRGSILFVTTKNTRNLKTSAKSLVEQHSCLELGYEWEPCKKCNWCEEQQSHQQFVPPCQCLHRSPELRFLNYWLACLSDL